VLATASGKGGVGKTNFCVNFALGLQRRGFQPVVIDADLGFADVEVLLGVRPRRTIVDVIEGTEIWDALEFGAHGLPFLSAGNGLLDLHDLTPWQMDRLLEQVGQLHERFDVVLLDCGAGMGANFGRMLAAVDDLVVVTTPEPTAIADAYALLKMLVVRGCLPETRLVINRVRNLAEGRETAEKLRLVANRFLDAKVDVLGFVLEDHTVARAVMEQRALLQAYPHSPAARCFDQLVHNYLRVETVQPSRGLGGFFERLLRRVRPAPSEEAADSSGHTA
ncbi:MAG: MinD/ParA family protein, partial [Alicyclobacillus sp.]|nr:MinD/ParA family protein [Alicyclobacillus sp.]